MKKFYKTADYVHEGQGFMVRLDDKPLRTPAQKLFQTPGEALARAVALEWQIQGQAIRKNTMPLTQIACVAIDLVSERKEEVLEDILPYAETDLICYRAGDIEELKDQQAQRFDPLVAWMAQRFGVILAVTDGLMPAVQPPDNQKQLRLALEFYDNWLLAAVACAVKPLGSMTLALALAEKKIDASEAFALSHLEESYETSRWGRDDEKERKLETARADIAAVENFIGLL